MLFRVLSYPSTVDLVQQCQKKPNVSSRGQIERLWKRKGNYFPLPFYRTPCNKIGLLGSGASQREDRIWHHCQIQPSHSLPAPTPPFLYITCLAHRKLMECIIFQAKFCVDQTHNTEFMWWSRFSLGALGCQPQF